MALIPRLAVAVLGLLAFTACGPREDARAPVVLGGSLAFEGDEGALTLEALSARATLTVLVFFSADCPVQKAHDARLREIATVYRERGVAFVAVSSEQSADVARLRAELAKRSLGMPLVVDRRASLADALGVEYTTHAVVLDRARRVLYSGGIDSERTHLTPNAEPWLRNALDAALAGRPVAKARTEPLGCPLDKH
jgi:peroxiredoxin